MAPAPPGGPIKAQRRPRGRHLRDGVGLREEGQLARGLREFPAAWAGVLFRALLPAGRAGNLAAAAAVAVAVAPKAKPSIRATGALLPGAADTLFVFQNRHHTLEAGVCLLARSLAPDERVAFKVEQSLD